MTPSDVAGVFSRYFIVGFFLPAFFSLIVLALTLTNNALPNAFESYSDGAQIAILGGLALLLGLTLLALNYQVLRAFEGYPLVAHSSASWIQPLHNRMIRKQHRRYDELLERSKEQGPDGDEAAWYLDRFFSEDPNKRLLPTAFGNAVRAFEHHSRLRWGLNSVAAWPRIELLLDTEQREAVADARSGVAFLLNGALLAALVGLGLLADLFASHETPWYLLWLHLVPFLIAWVAYRAAVGAAVIWGSAVRSAVDLKRLELYEALGVRKPVNAQDEREVVAPAINRCLLYAELLPNDLAGYGAHQEKEGKEQ